MNNYKIKYKLNIVDFFKKQLFIISLIGILLNIALLHSSYIDKNNYFSTSSSIIFNSAPSKAIFFNSKKNNKLYPEIGFIFNQSLVTTEKKINILFKSEVFYRGYITDNEGKIEGEYDFDFNRDFNIKNIFIEFNNIDNDSIFSFDIGRKDIELYSPLYLNDGLSFKINSFSSGAKFNFTIGKNQNYKYNLNKMSFDSLNILVGLSNIQTRTIGNDKNFFLDYEVNYTRTPDLYSSESFISSAISAYKVKWYQARTSFEYNISSAAADDDKIDDRNLTFFMIGASALSKYYPRVSANYSFVNHLTDDYGDTTFVSDNNFHNVRIGYKKDFNSFPKLSTKFYFDLQTGDYESRAITAIIKKEKFFFGNDFSVKAKFGTSTNYNLINLGIKTDKRFTDHVNLFLSYGVDIYAYITETGGDLSFAPNIFLYGKNLFKVENLSYKLYLRETVYPKSFFRKLLFKAELNYEVY